MEHYGGLMADTVRYRLLAQYWAKAIFAPLARFGRLAETKVLDYGCGTGVVSAALKNGACFDVATYACDLLRRQGREVFQKPEDIPRAAFDILLCSHSLEHYTSPRELLEGFKRYVRKDGFLVLVLPIETDFTPTVTPDNNQHLYGWTFQSITNLLLLCGWRPLFADRLYGPFLLTTLGRWLPPPIAVSLAYRVGRWKRGFPSMLSLAQVARVSDTDLC